MNGVLVGDVPFVATMMTCTGVEVSIAPPVSVALAVRLYSPGNALVHSKRNIASCSGPGSVSCAAPRLWLFAKISTVALAAGPSGSCTLEKRKTVDPALNAALLVGLLMLTVGGAFVG